VAQEALHNALRHSGATTICVSLSATRRRVILEVTDHGRGFAAEAPPPTHLPGPLHAPFTAPDRFTGGLGLASMRERAAAAGGTLTVRSRPGEGTLVRLDLPARAERS
jgi:signal transduction histidine kinase